MCLCVGLKLEGVLPSDDDEGSLGVNAVFRFESIYSKFKVNNFLCLNLPVIFFSFIENFN